MRTTIDGERFARDRASIEGSLVAAEAPRLTESGALDVRVDWRLTGIETGRGKPGIRVEATGSVSLECQRCLEPVQHPVDLDVELELAPDQATIDAAEDDVDRVVVSRSMDVQAMVEDEVLLDLPMVARHDDCAPKARTESQQGALASLLGERAQRSRKH